MKHIACSKMWTDLTISIPRKQIKHCCKRKFHKISENDIDRLGPEVFQFSSEIAEERRYTINENKLSQGCSVCIDMWPNSYWHLWNDWRDREWERQQLLDLEEKNIARLIEITLSSTCNMSCIYCAPDISSQWNTILNSPIKEDSVYKRKMLDALYGYIEKYQVDSTHRPLHYDFLGGEPLLDLEIFEVIETLLKMHSRNKEKDVTIGMITNLNIKPKLVERLVQRAEENPQVNWIIKVSIDALGTVGKEQRDGLDLALWEQNLRTLIQSPIINVLILPTVSNVSLASFPELIEYIIDLFNEYNQVDSYGSTWWFGENMVVTPLGLHPGTLPEEYKSIVDKCIETADKKVPNKKGKRKLMAFLNNLKKLIATKRRDEDLAEVKRFFEWQGKIKQKDYFDIFPSLKDILK